MNEHDHRAARQAVETDLLLGLDVVVLGSGDQTSEPHVDHSPPSDAASTLEDLEVAHAAECEHCTRASGYTNLVFGEGSETARLMFVGEAPGAMEDQLGRPFVGPAGQKLDEMIEAMGLSRQEVYIANVLKCRPPQNRTPLKTEAELCGIWLKRQIELIQPEVLVALGGPAAKLLLGTESGITRLRGAWQEISIGNHTYPVMPTFHPAYILRQYTPAVRREVWNDLQAVMSRLSSERG